MFFNPLYVPSHVTAIIAFLAFGVACGFAVLAVPLSRRLTPRHQFPLPKILLAGVILPLTIAILTLLGLLQETYFLGIACVAMVLVLNARGAFRFLPLRARNLLGPTWLSLLLIFGGTVACAGYQWRSETLAGKDMLTLLKGDLEISLTGFRIQSGNRIVICRDPEICRYLTAILRDTQTTDGSETTHCHIRFDFSTGRSYNALNSSIGEVSLTLSIPEANPQEYGLPTHTLLYLQPPPENLTRLVKFLTKPIPPFSRMIISPQGIITHQ